jgi:hypothetical protein
MAKLLPLQHPLLTLFQDVAGVEHPRGLFNSWTTDMLPDTESDKIPWRQSEENAP